MKTKICTKCGKEKSVSEFSKDKNSKSGYTSNCCECRKLNSVKFRNNIKILKPWYNSFRGAKERCLYTKHRQYKDYGGKGIKFLMTLDEFEFLWKRDNANLMKNPSIDRKNKNKDYIIDNCQFIEMDLNRVKDRYKSILQYDLEGNFIKEWYSLKEPRKIYGESVKDCVLGKNKTAYGFIWRYK